MAGRADCTSTASASTSAQSQPGVLHTHGPTHDPQAAPRPPRGGQRTKDEALKTRTHLLGHMPGAEDSTNWVLLSAQQTLEGGILITILQAGLEETESCGHCDGTDGTQAQASLYLLDATMGKPTALCVGGARAPSLVTESLTFPKSRTSKRSKGSNSSLFLNPNLSWQTLRKVRMFFKHRN